MSPLTRRSFLGAGAAVCAVSGSRLRAALPDDSFPFKLGVASYSFRKFPRARAIEMTLALNVRYINIKSFHLALESTPEQIRGARAEFESAGLTILGGGNIAFDKEDEADIRHKFEYAKLAGMPLMVCAPTHATLAKLERFVREYDIRLAIHNHGPDVKFFRTPGEIYEKIQDLDHRVGVCMDIGHTMRAGVDPSQAALQVGDRLLDIHMKDVSGATKAGKTIECGRGMIDIPKFFRTLDKIHYAGYVSFEFEKDANDPLPGLAESVGYVRGVLAAMG